MSDGVECHMTIVDPSGDMNISPFFRRVTTQPWRIASRRTFL
jgi:hypothetical protein